ncbi:phytoene desaturase family protein [Nocardia pseudovaccinii]|uniref:phytoene desaturase family protein n=1 Tax=Nocardia pseudovaccinii TaxID=189540 RepID=UPI003D923A23
MTTALIVGSGPNGLAAAVELAAEGVDVTVLEAADEIGGGTRSSEAIVPGLLHDHCAAFHPMAPSSAFFKHRALDRYGLRWVRSEIDCVHPLDDGSAGVLRTSVAETAVGLGADGPRWRRLFERNAAEFDELAEDILQPLVGLPRHTVKLARFGLPTLLPATVLARYFRTEQARALFAGIAAHAYQPLNRPLTSAIGLGIITGGHRNGWVVAAGCTQSIPNAMAALLCDLGAKIETGIRIERIEQLPPADITIFDLTPQTIANILSDRLPARTERRFRKFQRSPGAFKVDFAVEGAVPWTNPDAHAAGTVHLAGSFAETVAAETAIAQGRMPERPFVLVGQQYLADPQRSAGDVHPVYSYAHVPHGYTGDATEAIIAQFERFAPGFRDQVIGMRVRSATDMAIDNQNFVGGDIITGAKNVRQLVFGPRISASPYTFGVPGMYQCSAATAPGPGAHGMCGYNAARTALNCLTCHPSPRPAA